LGKLTKPPAHMIVAMVILAACAVFRISDPEPVARLRLSIFDAYNRAFPRIADASFPVKVVAIDEASLDRIGQWPWPRTKLAELVGKLAASGAQSITLDVLFVEPDRLSPDELARSLTGRDALQPLISAIAKFPSNDVEFARVLSAAPSILGIVGDSGGATAMAPARASMAFAGDDPAPFLNHFRGGITNLPVLSSAASGIGAVNWLPEQDHILRRIPLAVTIAGRIYPSLPLEALRVGTGQTTIFVKSSGASGLSALGQRTGIESIRVGNTILPTDGRGELWLKYALRDPRRAISAGRILNGDFQPEEIRHRHIFIGATAAGLLDQRATPLDASVPGVEIHAQALEQMLSGDHLVRPAYATGYEIAFLLSAGALVAWQVARSGAIVAALLALCAVGAVTAVSWVAYSSAGLLIDPVFPGLSVTALYLGASLTSYMRSELERSKIRNAFGHYLAPALVTELANNPGRLKLGGEQREVTLLFMDVRGFSGISESLDAESLIRFINRLFAPLAEAILKNRGTIDKFMGDAMMAFWNAPLPDPHHAASACRAALSMLDELTQLNGELTRQAAETGQTFAPIRIGIGLNTGTCVVGNVGSPERFDYSVLGDAVNVAARLEEATKKFGADIIAGARTAAAAPELAFLEIATITPRGKLKEEKIFALVGGEHTKSSPQFRLLADRHAALLEASRAGDLGAAASALAQCLDVAPPRAIALYRNFALRLDHDSVDVIEGSRVE